MNNLLVFTFFAVVLFLPAALFIVWRIYKNTIVFPIVVIVFTSAIFCSLVSFVIGERGFVMLVWVAPVCLVGLWAMDYFIKRIIQKPLIELKKDIDHSAKGMLDAEINTDILKKKDEIGTIANSLKSLVGALNKMSVFADEIGKENFNQDYELLSDKDKIGISLLNMRDSLLEAQKKEEARQEKENIESWANQGIAKFSDILRNDSNNMENLACNFITNLVDYLGAVQGGLFVLNDEFEERITYDLKGVVAYDRKKCMEKSFGLGESLVGRCAYEKMPILLKDVPNDYTEITSGLGTSNPNCILLVPAILNGKTFAIIELVSFKVFEEYKVKFVSNIGEDLASTIANTKVNEQTTKLLAETQQQQEELAAQEEEMRQNLEELQATQEEMSRKEKELTLKNEELTRKLEAFKQEV